MSERIEEGCTCRMYTSHGTVPCRWCESLTETEATLVDVYGYDILRWLQTHYLLYNGEWDYAPGPEATSLDEFINSSIILAQDDLNLRRGNFTRAYMEATATVASTSADLCKAALEGVIDTMKQIPLPRVTIYRDGMILPTDALPSAEVIPVDFKAKRRLF